LPRFVEGRKRYVPKLSSSLLIGATVLMSMGVAQAQFASPVLGGFGAFPGRGIGGEIEPVDDFDTDICNDIASGPSAVMSLEACRSMMAMQQRMQSASSDPNAVRPGDENLTCAQIHEEIRATGPVMSQATIAQNQQAGAAAMATLEQQKADTRGYVAGQVAMGVGSVALGMVPGVGGFATNAMQMAMDAREKTFEERQEAATASIMAQSAPAIQATEAEIGEAVRTNPRYARLMQLVVDKSCPPPTP
jgi:hypothetical protein